MYQRIIIVVLAIANLASCYSPNYAPIQVKHREKVCKPDYATDTILDKYHQCTKQYFDLVMENNEKVRNVEKICLEQLQEFASNYTGVTNEHGKNSIVAACYRGQYASCVHGLYPKYSQARAQEVKLHSQIKLVNPSKVCGQNRTSTSSTVTPVKSTQKCQLEALGIEEEAEKVEKVETNSEVKSSE